MNDKEIKEKLKEQALEFKRITGKFPNQMDIAIKNGFICSRVKLFNLFNNIRNFKRYCGIIDLKNAKTLIEIISVFENKGKWNNDCLEWQKHINGGYGQTTYKRKN